MKRENRIIARGEISGHSHVIIGNCEITREKNEVIIHTKKGCAIKHLLEKPFVEEGIEVWTKEHKDIILKDNTSYKFIQQTEYNPYEDAIRKVQD